MHYRNSLKAKIKKLNLLVFLLTKFKRVYKRQSSQSNEAEISEKPLKWHPSIPKNFIEFGFGACEFNCIKVAQGGHWEGLLLDGNNYQVRMANFIFHKKF